MFSVARVAFRVRYDPSGVDRNGNHVPGVSLRETPG